MRLDPQRRFHSIVVGPSNQRAVSLALRAVGRSPARPTPLLVRGPSGTGKTHLLQASANLLLRRRPGAGLQLLAADELAHRLVDSILGATTPAFHRALTEECDGLFVDDLDFLGGREATRSFLRDAVRFLVASGRPVVLVGGSDRGCVDSIATEHATGLVVDIGRPGVRERSIALARLARIRGRRLRPVQLRRLARPVRTIPEARGALERRLLEGDVERCPVV